MTARTDKLNGNGCAAEPTQQQRPTDGVDGIEGGDYKAITTISTDVSLPNDVLERIFQRYSIKQRCAGLESFLITSVLFDFWVICTVQQDTNYENIAVACIFLILNLALVIFLRFFGKHKYRDVIWLITPYLAWLFAILQLVLQLIWKDSVTARDFIGDAVLLNFLLYVTVPVPLTYIGISLGVGTFFAYVSTSVALAESDVFFWRQQWANVVLMLTAAAIGLLCYYLAEAKHRRAFLEAKQSLEVKMVIEEQSAEQERLLLSVLPEHVAVKVRQDLGSDDSEQFKKIYMSRHENVSILYADIVGFTAISSTYSAQDLVKMLNELFARFDRLAEKYHQLRIKILGDCYYCISGAIERPDHAVLCVYMGLSMVKAIKYVQQKTNSPVDMRVGIHTGAILAGILGQRQWQYDVYSKDVELANKMESSGMAGRVHISEKTLQCLSGEFEVEPAFGEKREETLRSAGLKTYFIKSVLKPFEADGNNDDQIVSPEIENHGASEAFKETDSKRIATDNDAHEESAESKEDVFRKRLRTELVSRDGHGEISKDTTWSLRFKNKELEAKYVQQRESMSSIPLVASLLVLIVGNVYSSIILYSTIYHFLMLAAPIVLLVPIICVSVAESFPMIFSDSFVRLSRRFNDITILRRAAAIVSIGSVGAINLTDMIICSSSSTNHPGLGTASTALNGTAFQSTVCTLYPSYFSNFAILILIATAVVVQLTHMVKFGIMLTIAVLHSLANFLLFTLDNHIQARGDEYGNLSLRFSLSALLIVISIALGLLSRHMDKEDRVIFKWKTEVSEQKEMASDMRRRNEKLVYNILPVHVAEYFISNKSRSYDELYSQSYDEVGVLFASMPNFSDFYSEDAVNNQGLECLRFLNEVISDFDALLAQFQDVIKIKTISSTYMAASGLNNLRTVNAADPVAVRWNHLATLVEFAIELKKALQCINEQSFNHFVLKMGINHGPITAGVIGARKPHYDIWGNTVNVASRMESTGKAGAIQVTQETCEILQTFGYTFEQRGLVAVKGKGQLMTYYLSGKTTTESRDASNTNGTPQHAAASANTKNQQNDLSARSDDPTTPPSIQSAKKSSASSCSNSPSSVRLNQNYETNGAQKPLATSATNHINHKAADTDGSEVADNEPLLQSGNNVAITTTATKRTNSRYGKADGKSGSRTAADSDNENETLIANEQ